MNGEETQEQELVGELVTLRPLKREYFSEYIQRFSETVKSLLHASSQESEIEYLSHRLENQNRGETFFYCIFTNTDNKLVGAIEIRNPQETGSQLYSWVNEQYWGTGVYQEALALISEKYFKETDENIYKARVDTSNLRSYYALKKHGFLDSGVFQGPYGKQYALILRKKRRF